MNGYGQPVVQNDQLAQMLMQQQQNQQRQQSAQGLMNNSGHAGLAGVLGAALGGYMNRKKGDELAQGNADIERQIAQIQEQTQRDIEAKKQSQLDAKWKREDSIRAEKQAAEMAKLQAMQGFTAEQNQLNRQGVNQRHTDAQNMSQQQFDALQAFRQAQLANKQQPQGLYTQQEQAIIEANPELEQQIKQKKIDELTGVKEDKPLSDTVKNKLSFIKNARDKLAQYKKEAFIDGDYQEFGSKFGNTNNLLTEAVRNKLRAESGAAISDQELASEKELFDPSMFRSDETNMAKINEFEKTLASLERELTGGQEQQKTNKIKSQPLTSEDMNATLMKY